MSNLSDGWRQLHNERFSDLPLDCGNESDPGIIYSEDLRDWSDKATTPDQRRIEDYIDRFDLRAARVLHIGVGNCGLARRMHKRVGEIVGTTIDEPEISVAKRLRLRNYSVVKHNKYAAAEETAAGRFDFIVDNNPTSPCCCIRHLAALFDFYRTSLSERGQVVTDQEGLRWVPDTSNPRWSFTFEDLSAVAPLVGLSAYRGTSSVYILSPIPPPEPTTGALWRHRLRRLLSFPRRSGGAALRWVRRLFGAAASNRRAHRL